MQLLRQVGMQTCPEVLKEPSKRRCRWTGVPTESRTLVWFQLPESPPTTCQATRPASTATASEASTGTASHLRKPKLRRRCRECVHGVDNVSEDKSSVRQRIRTKTCSNIVFATILGRMRAHDGPGQRSPGPAHPPPGWNAGTSNERNTNNRQAILFYWWVPTDRPNLRLGSRKGTYCPKWEV